MKRLCTLFFLLSLPVACAGLPEIHPPADGGTAHHEAACASIFPQGQWQLAHAIQAKPPGGSQQTMIGLIRMSSAERTFECAMMTLEGVVLFEAHYDGNAIDIRKAIPPMDTPGLAEGMIEDILLVFFAPDPPPAASGHLRDQARICRYPVTDQGTQDIIVHPDGRWEIRRYSADKRLVRTIVPDGTEVTNAHGIPSRVELKAHGRAGYQLNLSMMEAIPMDMAAED